VHPLVENAGLTSRERQTLRHLLRGRAESEVARQMKLGHSTVHVYVKSIYVKFRVRSRAQLMAKFLTHVKV
jgi:DNA-binding NarL/FixJ family response regulator